MSSAVTALFTDLGRAIDGRWSSAEYDSHRFPAIVAEALRATPLHERTSADEILEWVLFADVPEQIDPAASFGEPPVTLFRTERFFIQVLFWQHGSTAVHHHGFSGAFAVLQGSSVHTTWSFQTTHRINDHLLFGDLEQRNVALIGPGAIEAIDASLIHCVFHLDVPSVTIVVRTYSDFLPHPQYTYLRPHVAIYQQGRTTGLTRRVQALRLMARLGHPRLGHALLDYLGRCDVQSAFIVCTELLDALPPELADRALDLVGARTDERRLRAVVEQMRRERVLTALRAETTNGDLRFFLALLLTLDRRCDVLELIRQHTGCDDAREVVARLIAELAERAPGEVPRDEVNAAIVRCLLAGGSDEDVLQALSVSYGSTAVSEQQTELREQVALFKRSVLAPLFG